MSKFINKNKLTEARKSKVSSLLDIADGNQGPIKGVEETLKGTELAKPFSSGDPVRDLRGIDKQLNYLPQKLKECSPEQLSEMWDNAVKVGRRSIWIMAQIALTIQSKYGEENVRSFSAEKGLSLATVYNYIKLAETFPSIDATLDTSFYYKALTAGHGDKDKSIEYIEMAKKKKRENSAYSVRDFEKDLSSNAGSSEGGKSRTKQKPSQVLLAQVVDDLGILSTRDDLISFNNELKKLNSLVEKINLRVKKVSGGH